MFSILYENVTKIYEDGTVGLNNVSLKINGGEFVFLLGQSGSGKSTLLSLLTREQTPTKGKVYFGEEELSAMHPKQLPYLRRKLGIIREDNLLLEQKTIYENIEFALLATEHPSKNRMETVFKALGMVGMRDKAQAYPQELSGGEKSRVELARAIANNPSVILADEPTSGLDQDAAWDIATLLNEINRRGVTIIMATHDKALVNIMNKRVVTLYEGRLIGDAKNGKYGYLI